MTIRLTCLAVVCVMGSLMSSQVKAQQKMPEQVHATLSNLVGAWDCESVVDGKTYKSQLSAEWSPNKHCVIYTVIGSHPVTGEEISFTGILLWDGVKKALVEHGGGDDGSTMQANHHILSGKEWNSPTTRSLFIDGKYSHSEALRKFRWKTDDEWEVTSSFEVMDGESIPTAVATFRRRP